MSVDCWITFIILQSHPFIISNKTCKEMFWLFTRLWSTVYTPDNVRLCWHRINKPQTRCLGPQGEGRQGHRGSTRVSAVLSTGEAGAEFCGSPEEGVRKGFIEKKICDPSREPVGIEGEEGCPRQTVRCAEAEMLGATCSRDSGQRGPTTVVRSFSGSGEHQGWAGRFRQRYNAPQANKFRLCHVREIPCSHLTCREVTTLSAILSDPF